MRITLFAPLALALAAAPALAEDRTFAAKFEEVSNNCNNVGLSLNAGTVKVNVQKASVTVTIDRIPTMKGAPGKNGAVRAESTNGPTSIPGLDGKFSVAGRVADGALQFVFVAEYFAKGKALCTQSWEVTGAAQ